MHTTTRGVRPVTKLEQARRALGLRQEDMARLAGCHRVSYSTLENGSVPRAEVRERIAEVVGVAEENLWPRAVAAAS